MPSGTGKTITILALVVAYLHKYPEKASKLVYCSRTVPEIDKSLSELKRLLRYRQEHMLESSTFENSFLGIGLSARRHLCINANVTNSSASSTENSGSKTSIGKSVDSRCHNLTASWIRQKALMHPVEGTEVCVFFEKLESNKQLKLPAGVYSMDELKNFGRLNEVCPYFLARKAVSNTDYICNFSITYLDPNC